MYEIQKTTNYRFQYSKLELRFKRFIDEAIEVIKESPMDYQGKIMHLGNRKEGGLYRFRTPGLHLLYVVPAHEPGTSAIITLTAIKKL